MNEQQPITPENKLQNIAEQNKKMRKKLLIALAVTVGVVAILITVLLIIKASQNKDEPFTLPDTYFYPTYQGDIFEYADYLDKRPDVIFYCEDPDGLGRTTSIDADREEEFTPETLYLRDFLLIMMRADIDAYNNCFNEIYYKKHKEQEQFSQQMIYEAEIRFAGEEKAANGEKTTIYYLFYKLYENDGSLRRDVGSDAVVPMRVVLRTTPTGEISISEWETTRTK
ncbi:MAG: hypothetical protein J6Q70_05705 [Clostridia bacterium]|nr:hypothetical protein [Clostridia bacterium]